MKVGFIGAGRMGRPMVARLVEAGHEVRVVGRTDEQRRKLEQLGARPVGDVAEAGARADVVLVCVFTDEQVRQVCLDGPLLSTMPPGSTLAVHTTASPTTIADIAARAGDVGVVDAPVSGGPHDIAAGGLTLFVGGADEAVARARTVLRCYGDPVLHVGPLGTGQKVKLVNNALFAGHIGLLAESIRLGERLGVPESTLLDALPFGSATSRVLDIVAAGGSIASFVEVAGEFVGKDVAVARGIAAELGGDLGALDAVIGVVGPLASNARRV
ncbi:NAD(P)-dependent oxidoreductase [Mycobacterium interjectum]|uniref:NAD(P)-dependent oxidoreductase n=1 Tax=Mycobacterium interjectum TaxID=33895 RepID=UPI0009FC1F99|nr:NAD(P)-dependent oxidoreductase [Mycobacterium interjectum]MCV7091416.1 NAD(P)-dependent oxidoreductase [Mycobacterium interjectum]